jgi:hypothetical protein
MLGLRRGKSEERPNSSEQPDLLVLDRRIAHLETALKLMDVDLQDAIDGFYRRRQADRMREVRQDSPQKKRTTDRDILMRALQLSDDGRRKNETDDSHSTTSD